MSFLNRKVWLVCAVAALLVACWPAPFVRRSRSDRRSSPSAIGREGVAGHGSSAALQGRDACHAFARAPGPSPRSRSVRNGGGSADADESPWSHAHASAPAAEATDAAWRSAACLSDTDALLALFEAMPAGHARRESFRRLLHGSESEMAAALAVFLSAGPETETYGDLVATLKHGCPPEAARRLVAWAAAAQDGDVRNSLLRAVHEIAGPAVANALVRTAAETDNAATRQDMLLLLASRRAAADLPALADAFQSDDPELANAAAWGAAMIGGTQACAMLAEAAEAGRHPALFAAALGETRSPFSPSALLTLATDKTRSPPVRLAAVRALSALGGDRVRLSFSSALSRETDGQIAEAMRAALAHIHEQSEPKDPGELSPDARDEIWH